MTTSRGRAGPLDWAWAVRALPGELLSGDRAVVVESPRGAMIGVIDGLGHGPSAALAAREAAAAIESVPADGVERCMRACHAALRSTRGAAIALVSLTTAGLEWSGVGNVEAVVVHGRPGGKARSRLVGTDGIVGHAMPPLRIVEIRLEPGDLLVSATDGVAAEALDAPERLSAPPVLAETLLAQHARRHDDALVFVGRFLGGRT